MSRRALVVAGLDPSAGAGILLDAFVLAWRGYRPCAVTTLVSAQNSAGFLRAEPVGAKLVADQIASVLAEGPLACVKVGAVGSGETARLLAEVFAGFEAPLVYDPVLESTTGGALFHDADTAALDALARASAVTTPNTAEAALLTGAGSASDFDGACSAARALGKRWGCAVVVTGVQVAPSADGRACAADVLYEDGSVEPVAHSLVEGVGDVRGTGCMFATSLAASLGEGSSVRDALCHAQRDVASLLALARQIGKGSRQVDIAQLIRSR